MMFQLKPEFQREIFRRAINKYKGSIKISKSFDIPASSIRGYKNLYFKTVPKNLIDKLRKLRIVKLEELGNNILSVHKRSDQIKENLDLGREKRKVDLKNLRDSIPPLKDIMSPKKIYLEKWFNNYKHLLSSGFRKVYISESNEFLNLRYLNYAQTRYKNFRKKIPKNIKMNNSFIYFFGLWCGDRSGGKRLGICNKNKEIIDFTENFLKNYSQKIERILYITKSLKEPKINYDKKFIIDKEIKGWVLSVHTNNGVFASFFQYLYSNLEDFLTSINNKYPFFAGLFDAEGNVSIYNKSFRWACKNNQLVNLYSKFLNELDLFDRYDGSCLITYNTNKFYKKILRYMKNSEKINHTKFLCKGSGNLPGSYYEVLKFVRDYPNMTSKEIAKALNKNKVYSELKVLSDFSFVGYKGYPYKFKITSKGLKSLGAKNHNSG